jgi:hypothetical protein
LLGHANSPFEHSHAWPPPRVVYMLPRFPPRPRDSTLPSHGTAHSSGMGVQKIGALSPEPLHVELFGRF